MRDAGPNALTWLAGDEIPRFRLDTTRATTEPEAFWEWPGMFWRSSTGPVRRAYAALRARAST